MVLFFSHIRQYISFSVIGLFWLMNCLPAVSQVTEITGVINDYVRITGWSDLAGRSRVTVTDNSIFKERDIVMFLVTEGLELEPDGSAADAHNAGYYAIMVIDSLKAGNLVVFTTTLPGYIDPLNSFEKAQLIRMPHYQDARITGTLTCDSYDPVSGTGGVLAFFVDDSLIFNGKIDITGKGFPGAPSENNVIACSTTDPSGFDKNYFTASATDSAALKGKGPIRNDFSLVRGKGPLNSGGGGGNGKYSGGGGGGNFSVGGPGGYESDLCGTNNEMGGAGGISLLDYYPSYPGDLRRLFLGGGGGAGSGDATRQASSGGTGGGILFFYTTYIHVEADDTIRTNGESIGFSVTGGAGGGGAGGVILFEIGQDLYEGGNRMVLEAIGGKGGNTNHPVNKSGPGGYGGNGVVYNNKFPLIGLPKGFVKSGARPDSSVWEPGSDFYGTNNNRLATGGVLKIDEEDGIRYQGLFFNFVPDGQLICEGTQPAVLDASSPKNLPGAAGFQWEVSIDSTNWYPAPGVADQEDYQPPVLTKDSSEYFLFRRIVSSFSLTDVSLATKIDILDSITGNMIGDVDTVCFGADGPVLNTKNSVSGGDYTNYGWQWESSPDQSSWDEEGTSESFQPFALTDTTYFRRIVFSSVCVDTSNRIPIKVLNPINNTLQTVQDTTCSDLAPDPILGNPASGGQPGSMNYVWQRYDPDLDQWDTLTGATGIDHAPGILLDPAYWNEGAAVDFRRIAYSPAYKLICVDSSARATIVSLPLIQNNTLFDSVACFETADTVEASIPGDGPDDLQGGRGDYTYLWEQSSDGVNWSTATPGPANNASYIHPPLSEDTYFRRLVNSGACTDQSDSVLLTLYPLPAGRIQDIREGFCYVPTAGGFTDSTGNSATPAFQVYLTSPSPVRDYVLRYTDGNDEFTLNADSDTLNIELTGSTENQSTVTYWLTYLEDRYGCEATSLEGSAVFDYYKKPDSRVVEENLEVCGDEVTIQAYPDVGTPLWIRDSVFGAGNSDHPMNILSPSSSTTDVVFDYQDEFRLGGRFIWTETNWLECSDSDTVEVLFYKPPPEPRTVPDVSLFFATRHTLTADPVPFGQGRWYLEESLSSGEIKNIEQADSNIAVVNFNEDNLKRRQEFYLIWELSHGICPVKTDTLIITRTDLGLYQGFSPNGDGLNEYFVIDGLEFADQWELVIYSHYGNEIFRLNESEHDDYASGLNNCAPGVYCLWDGLIDGIGAPEEGTYYYTLTVKVSGLSYFYKGFFVIQLHEQF